jgi:GT2 family glycosyltransferase
MTLPTVSVVFLAYDRREALAQALTRMLGDSGYPAAQLEVIVVDNASSDGTSEMVAADFPQVRLLRNEHNVGASGWNAGFRVAAGDYVLILDDDAYLERGGLEQAVTAAIAEGADLVSFTVVSSEAPDHRLNDDWRTGLLSYWGCAALLSRRALDSLGGYDPRMFIWANEAELTMRLLDAGFTHLFLPEVCAVHMKAAILDFEPRRYQINARHHAYIAGKLMRPADALVVLANLLLSAAIDTAVVDRRARGALGLVVRGALDGVRNRAPVRGVVSAAYRKNFRPFAGPLRFLRTPAERLGATDRSAERQERYFNRRPRFNPPGRATLRL